MLEARFWRKILLAISLVVLIPGLIVLARPRTEFVMDTLPEASGDIDESLFHSNQYTQPDDLTPVSNHLDIPASFDLVGENDSIQLYAENPNGAIRVVDKTTGYIYGSSFAESGLDIPNFNTRWEGIINSACVIEYYAYNETTGAYLINEESFFTSEETTLDYRLINNGYELQINYGESGISLKIRVYLDDDYLRVEVPKENITDSEDYPLRSVKVFPFLGAVYGDSIPGYIFVPDGSGALIRYKEIGAVSDIYEFNYYGTDTGITRTDQVSENFTLPVSGMILGIKQNGFIQIIESGDPFATLVVSPAKNNLRYYYTYNNFVYRQLYLTPTSLSTAASGSGQQVIEASRNTCDIKLVYAFLSGDNADYIGMANAYRDYLYQDGTLTEGVETNDIPALIEIIGADTSPGFILDELNVMTSYEDASSILADLKTFIPALTIVYKGFGKNGYSSGITRGLTDSRLGTRQELENLIEAYDNGVDSFHLYENFQSVSESASYNSYRDLSQRIDSSIHTYDGLFQNWSYLSPLRTKALFTKTIPAMEALGAGGVALGSIGYRLFSDYKDKDAKIDRQQAISIYQEALAASTLDLALYRPNAYLLQYASKYLAAPTTTTGYQIYTDTVPFLSTVLAGSMEAYGPYANFWANSVNELLVLVDYGLLPAFILTEEPAYLLAESELGWLYSSDYEIWKSKIKSIYEMLEPAYQAFYGERVVSREVPDYGITRVTYANGVNVYINHTGKAYTYGSVQIPALSFEVVIASG